MNEPNIRRLENCIDSETVSLLYTKWFPDNKKRLVSNNPKENSKIHVSVNLSESRFRNFICGSEIDQFDLEDNLQTLKKAGELTVMNIFGYLQRWVNELCFGRMVSAKSPIYGALNCCAERGGAPYFGRHYWLKLKSDKIKGRTTFSTRDSMDITSFAFIRSYSSAQSACRAISSTIMDWDTAIAYFMQDHKCVKKETSSDEREYVEAQIWGGVNLDDVEEIHIVRTHRSLKPLVEEMFVRKYADSYNPSSQELSIGDNCISVIYSGVQDG